MSSEAYIDREKTKKISIEKAVLRNDDAIYYCKNIKCHAELKVVVSHGEDKPYFRAIHSKPHIKHCLYSSDDFAKFSIEDFNEKEFNPNINLMSLIDDNSHVSKNINAINKSNNTNIIKNCHKKHFNTIKNIYYISKEKREVNLYNSIKISDYFIEYDRNTSLIKSSGVRLVECKSQKFLYDNKKSEIKFYTRQINNIILKFDNKELYREIRDLVFAKRKQDIYYVIAGYVDYDENNNIYIIRINCKRQISHIK